jgi:hypothetical protein
VILAGWGMPDAELLRALQPLLEPKEIAVVTQALGLDDEQAWTADSCRDGGNPVSAQADIAHPCPALMGQ